MSNCLIKENDSVILFKSKNVSFLIKPKQINKQLRIDHHEIIGMPYNTKYKDCILLKCYPDQIIKTTTKQTQILYEADISCILFYLNIKRGDTILECGTGSGVLTNILSARVDHGIVHTFERNKERFNELKDAFNKNVIVKNLDLEDACLEDDFYDAIFLDLPQPYKVLEKCFNALKNSKKICIFVPTIEQVLITKEIIQKYFLDIKMLENIKREYQQSKANQKCYIVVQDQYSHTGFLLFATK